MASQKRSSNPSAEQRSRSVFDLPSDFFNSCRLLSESGHALSYSAPLEISASEEEPLKEEEEEKGKERKPNPRLSCNTCKADFDSLQDQRFHFKSDIHRFNAQDHSVPPYNPDPVTPNAFASHGFASSNFPDYRTTDLFETTLHGDDTVQATKIQMRLCHRVKLSLAGKDTVKEEEFDEMTGESLFKDYDISSISGSEDEVEKVSSSSAGVLRKAQESIKQKLFIRLQSGDIVSVWKRLLLNELEDPLFESNKIPKENTGSIPGLREGEFVERLNRLIHEPRNKTHLRIVLLASGGHFAGCVFDGMSIVAYKTFHRYVVRAKAGKKQSSKDATGKAANSAGSSLRRYNEIALKKDVQELLTTWKPYFDASLCVFIYAPSNNRKLLFDGEKPHFFHQNCAIQNVPLTVRRPTLKEAKRIYNYLTNIVYEVDEKQDPNVKEDLLLCASDVGKNNQESSEEQLRDQKKSKETPESCSDCPSFSGPSMSAESEVISTSVSADEPTALHDAANSGDAQRTLELLEQGLDPCIKDARGRTPYMLATEKEVRNTFRRFMALNLDKWDWHAANVPSPLTKEMEESQAAKQAEKDAKKKAKSKELKKLRKAKEKAQAQVAPSQISSAIPHGQGASAASVLKGHSQSNSVATMSKEEALAEEREKRAAAAEKRMAALNALAPSATTGTSATPVQKGEGNDVKCSCCMASLAGKVPFHRYNYKYCSTSCMHVHREMLEDG